MPTQASTFPSYDPTPRGGRAAPMTEPTPGPNLPEPWAHLVREQNEAAAGTTRWTTSPGNPRRPTMLRRFTDRRDAGRAVGEALAPRYQNNPDVIVLGL